MIEHVPHAQAPITDIDAYVSDHVSASPYHRSGWLTAVERAYGHPGLWLISYDGPRINGLLPLSVIKTPFRKDRLVSLPFCDVGGVLADSEKVSEDITREAIQLISTQRTAGLELRDQAAESSDDLENKKVRMIAAIEAESSDELLSSYKPKLRSQIKKAEKNGLTARWSQHSAADVEEFYKVYSANMKRLGSPAHSLEWFKAVQAAYGEKAVIGLVYKDEIVVGAGFVLLNGTQASIPWASTLSEYNPLAPNMLLYWTLLSFVADRGYNAFDFGRSTFGEGTYRFKKQWGALPAELCWNQWGPSGARQIETPQSTSGLTSKVRPLLEQGWQKLPLSLANSLGPRLRRYITL